MGIVGWLLIGLASLATFVFWVQLVILAFKTSTLWGVLSLIIPGAQLVYVIKYWSEGAKTPFLRQLACVPVLAIGFALVTYSAISSGMAAPTP